MARLGIWGVAGLIAVLGAVLTANEMSGVRRASQAADVRMKSLQDIADGAQRDTRRILAAIETLNADRDRLFARVTIAEKNLEDAKGAFAQQIAAAMTPKADAVVAAVPPSSLLSPEITGSVGGQKFADAAQAATPASMSSAAQGPSGEASVTVAASEFPRRSGGLPLPAMRPGDAPAREARAENGVPASDADHGDQTTSNADGTRNEAFAIDLGGAKSIAAMRTLWRGLSRKHAELGSLEPLIGVQERRKGQGMELRLLAGPFADQTIATSMCAMLAKAGHANCRSAAYDGQHLQAPKTKRVSAAPLAVSRKPEEQKPGGGTAQAEADARQSERKSEPAAADQTATAGAKPDTDLTAKSETAGEGSAEVAKTSTTSRPVPPAPVQQSSHPSPKIQTQVQTETPRTASDESRNPLERLFGLGR